MKLIKRTTLQYSEGSSDKVYEVDICQIPEGSYVVNFRYGKRGANLKEGTKTTQPVNLPEAQRAFDKLIQEKTKKGYQDVTSPSIDETPPVETPVDKTARKQAVLNRLASNQPSKWKLERAIWRAGELKISEATPLLIKLIGTGEPLRDYCIAWSLGYCGGEDALSALVRLYQNATSPEFVSRIAFEALLKLADAATKAELQAEMVEFLPKELQKLARIETEQFAIALKSYLEGGDYRRFAVLDTIYRIDNQYIRPALLEILRTAPLKPSYFKYVRHIFKVAEYRYDAEVFAILAYRFEKESGNFFSYSYREWNAVNRGYTSKIRKQYEDELKSPNSNKAYSNQTREYLRNRTWRTIKQLGKEGDSNYIDMAVEMLLQYSDTNAEAPRNTVLHRWNSPNMHRSWDAYASCINLNHILYENSPRYELKHNSKAWCCREGYKPGDATPEKREEAFPELWNQHPEALKRLLLESECLPVHEFAVKAIKASQVFCASINIDTIIKLLQKAYEITAEFGFELAQLKYNPQKPNRELVFAVISCVSQSARSQGYQWIEAKPEYFLEDSSFIFALLTSQHEDTRSFGRRLLSFSILSDAAAKVILGRIITELLAFTTENNSEIVKEISEIVLLRFAPQLQSLNMGVISDLLAHPMLEVQEFGAKVLLNHQISSENLPQSVIESLLASPYESLRIIGIQLFGQLPDAKLVGEERELVIAIALNPNLEIRNAVKPIVTRLAIAHPNFAIEIANEFIEILLAPEKHEGIHSYLVNLLKELQGWMTTIPKQTALKLLQVKSTAAQELGGVLLQANYPSWIYEITTSEIVKLADCEIIAVREAARQMFLQILDRLRNDTQEMMIAVRILEAKWQDTREFAFQVFTTEFTPQEFTPQVLVSICDSVREEARRLGRDLLTRNFQSHDSEEYLLKFSEHPASDMQTFVTNYLEEYAINNPERIQELTSYFITVLSSVNRSRVAKQRIFKFLDREAQKSETAAQIIAGIMTRQSLTMVIADKAATIEIMLNIRKKYPHLSIPIKVKEVVEIRK